MARLQSEQAHDGVAQPVQDEEDTDIRVLNGSFKMDQRGDNGKYDQYNLGRTEAGLCLHVKLLTIKWICVIEP